MVHIIADSTSGLSTSFSQEFDVPIVPQIIVFGEDSYRDSVEMGAAMFMERLLGADELPKTAAPPPEWFHEHLKRFIADGEPVLCIHPSHKVSGTVRSALVAKQSFPDADIRVLDTLSIGVALGWMVIKAAEWAGEGQDVDTIWAGLEDLIARQRIHFTVDTLEFLQRGGRIGGARALLGSLLRIRPVLTWREGQVEPLVNERTRGRALQRMVDIATEEAPRDRDPLFGVMHAAAPDVAQDLADRLRTEFPEASVMVQNLVPAIVTHGGPGTIGLGYFA